MATTYLSDLIVGRTVVRPDSMNDAVGSITGRVLIPASTNLAIGDVLKLVRVDWGVVPLRFILQSDLLDSNNLLAATLGIIQIAPGTLYASTNTSGVFQTYDVPTATTNASPATSAASIAAAATINTTLRAGGSIQLDTTGAGTAYVTSYRDGFAGPVDIGLTATVAGTGAAATDMYVTLTMEYVRKRNVEGSPQVDRGGF